jgi:hypothetical protein
MFKTSDPRKLVREWMAVTWYYRNTHNVYLLRFGDLNWSEGNNCSLEE